MECDNCGVSVHEGKVKVQYTGKSIQFIHSHISAIHQFGFRFSFIKHTVMGILLSKQLEYVFLTTTAVVFLSLTILT